MTQPLDAQELLERIRRARDWADAEAAGLPDPEHEYVPGDSPSALKGAAYRAVRDTLDQILNPGNEPERN